MSTFDHYRLGMKWKERPMLKKRFALSFLERETPSDFKDDPIVQPRKCYFALIS